MRTKTLLLTTALVSLALAGCTGGDTTLYQSGSSTVLPLAAAWAEDFGTANGVQINVAGGGSGAGASGLCNGELDLADMSRKIKDSEVADCRAKGIEPVEWIVAWDGLSVVVGAGNSFVKDLSMDQLHHIFRKDNHARMWDEVDPAFPAQPIRLCYPDADSGTYEYFNEAILDEGEPRTGAGVQQSPDDNVLVTCLASDASAIGYFGYAYYVENTNRVNLVKVGGVAPSEETVAGKTYTPLSRPLHIYTNGVPEKGTVLYDYLHYILSEGQELVPTVGYVKLDAGTRSTMLARLG